MTYSQIILDEITYTPEQVGWVIEDYTNTAERSILQRRQYARAASDYKAGAIKIKPDVPDVISPKDQFIREVKARNDYNWIVAIVMVRNEFDPMHSLRVQMMKTTRTGGSTFDIMRKHIDDVLRDTKSTYADRARAKDYIKIIEDMGKKWNPKEPITQVPNVNVAVINNTPDKSEPKEIIDVSPVGGLKKVKNG